MEEENMFFLNNEKSSPFTQRQPLSCSSLFLLQSPLQSPPPEIMSSSSITPTAFCFPPRSSTLNNSSSIVLASSNKIIMSNDLANNESEFSFLESKPSLLDQRLVKGGGKPPKGRRNAGEAMYRRKLANKAFLVRVGGGGPCGGEELNGNKSNIIGGGWGVGGHRGRGVLSELMAEQYSLSVPYSLNRKSRWMKDGIDWLSELSSDSIGQKLRYCLAEADYSLAGTQSIRAFHSLNSENGYLQSKISKSKRGAYLNDLRKQFEEDEEENNDENNNIPQINFHLARPNLLKRVFAGKIFTRRKSFYSFRSCTKSPMEISSSYTSPTSRSSTNNNLNKSNINKRQLIINESEPEEENEFIAQYRPKRETYSLADFIKENNKNSSSSPLIIRRGQSNKNKKGSSLSSNNLNNSFDDYEDYSIIPKMDFIELPDDLINNNNENKQQNKIILPPLPTSNNNNNQLISSIYLKINQLINNNNENNNLINFTIKNNYLNNFNKNKNKYSFNWLNNNNLLLIDLTNKLNIKLNLNQNQLLIIIISPTNIFINSLINLNKNKLNNNIFLNNNNQTIDQLINLIIENVKTDFIEWEINQKNLKLSSTLFENFKNIFHSNQLALIPKPISIISIIEKQRELIKLDEWNEEEDLLFNKKDIINLPIDDNDETFEFININELNNNENNNKNKCFNCNDENKILAMISSCGHRFCQNCLINNIKQQLLLNKKLNLHCPLCPKSFISFDILNWLFPLSIVNLIVLLNYINNNNDENNLIECPNCNLIFKLNNNEEKQQIICNKCSINFCKNCKKEPHWPLNCFEFNDFNKKLNEKQLNGGQFIDLSNEAKTRRMDIRLNWQLGKHVKRIILNENNIEQRFGNLRKTALLLIEYGLIWLYLNKNLRPRPNGWSQLKSLILTLNDRIECLDNEILFSSSLTDSKQLILKFNNLEQLNEKCLVKFGIIIKQNK